MALHVHGPALLALIALMAPASFEPKHLQRCASRLGKRLDRLGEHSPDARAAAETIRAVCRTCARCLGPGRI